MNDWSALTPGDEATIIDDGIEVRVVHPKTGVYVVRRHFDGAWQDVAWVRSIGSAWGVARELDSLGTPAENLQAGIELGVLKSREALNRYR